jgi:hypothetical protein
MNCNIQLNADGSIQFTFGNMDIRIDNSIILTSIQNDIQTSIKDVVVYEDKTISLFYTEQGYISNTFDNLKEYQNNIKEGIEDIKTKFNTFTDELKTNDSYDQLEIHSKLYFACLYTITILTRVFVCTMIDEATPCSNTGNTVRTDRKDIQNKINQLKTVLMDTTRLLLNMDNVGEYLQVQTGGEGDDDVIDTSNSIEYKLAVVDGEFFVYRVSNDGDKEMTKINLDNFDENEKDKLKTISILNDVDNYPVGLGTINMFKNKNILEKIKLSLQSLLTQIKDETNIVFQPSLENSLDNSSTHKRFLALVYIRHAIYKTAAKMYVFATVAITQHIKCADSSADDLKSEYDRLVQLYKDTTKLLLNIEQANNISNSSELNTVWPSLS